MGDLPTCAERPSGGDLVQLVDDVQTRGVPKKKKLAIRPRGGVMVYLCTVCATVAKSRNGICVGFQIEDSWETTAAEAQAPSQDDMVRTAARTRIPAARAHDEENSSSTDSSSDVSSVNVSFGDSASRLNIADSKERKFSSAKKARKTIRQIERRLIMPEYLRLGAKVNAMSSIAFRACRTIPADYLTTPVTLHRRGANLTSAPTDPLAIAKEVQILLECQHQNILLLLGFVLEVKGGPALVMERTWGSVQMAISLAPLSSASAILIGAQVASALEHMHKYWVFHGNVGVSSVYLLCAPGEGPMISKLADFSGAEMPMFDYNVLAEDIYAFCKFVLNLFTKNNRLCAVMDATQVYDKSSWQHVDFAFLSEEERTDVMKRYFAFECVELPDLEVLLTSILSGQVYTAKEVAEKFEKMRQPLDQRVAEPLDVENAAALRMRF